jgi:hypothetical protein
MYCEIPVWNCIRLISKFISNQEEIMKSLKTILAVTLILVLTATMMVGCSEQPYPSKAIDVVCPGGAGSGGAVLLRVICKYLADELGVTVNVINTTGGSGVPAVQSVLSAQQDGYTLMGDQAYSSSNQVNLDELPYDIFEDGSTFAVWPAVRRFCAAARTWDGKHPRRCGMDRKQSGRRVFLGRHRQELGGELRGSGIHAGIRNRH